MLTGCGGTIRNDETTSAAGASGSSTDSNVASADASASGTSGDTGGGSLSGLSSAAGAESGGGAASGISGAGGAQAEGTPTIGDDGYVQVFDGAQTLVGYVGSYVGGSNSSITLSYDPTSFCASGTVGISSTYQSYAGAGFNVNQSQSTTGSPVESLLLVGNSIIVSFTNRAKSPLRLQVINSSITTWCYDLSLAASPITIPLSSLNTRCWDGSGDAFTPGTSITAIQLIVPGSATRTIPFDFCLDGVVIQ